MPRKSLYKEGTSTLHISLARPVCDDIQRAAALQRQSTSQLINAILEDYLLRRGDLREREEAVV